jgi:hypothetical protein
MRFAAPKSAPSSRPPSTTIPDPTLPGSPEVLARGLRITVRQAWAAGRALGLAETAIQELIRRAGVRAIRAINPGKAAPLVPDGYSRRRRLEAFIAAELLEAVKQCGIIPGFTPIDFFAGIGRASNEAADALARPLPVASGDAPNGPPKRGNYNL